MSDTKREEWEIDLLGLLKTLLLQWRAMVALGIILGLIMMVGKYALDVKEYKTAMSNQSASDVSETLTEEELMDVQIAAGLHDRLEIIRRYNAESPALNVSPLGHESVSLVYKVETPNTSDVKDIVCLYALALESDEVSDDFASVFGDDYQPEYVNHLININNMSYPTDTLDDAENSSLMVVSCVVPEGVDIDALTDALKAKTENIGETIQGYDYKLAFVKSQTSHQVEMKYLSDQYSLISMQTNYTNTLKQMVSAFSGAQLNRYNELISDSSDEAQVDQAEDIETAANTLVAPSISKKYALIGFVLGVVLYVFAYVVYLLFGSKMISPEAFRYTDSVVVGLVRLSNQSKSSILRFLFFDRIIYKCFYKRKDDLLLNSDNIAGQIDICLGEGETNEIQLLQVGFDTAGEKPMVDVVESIAKMGTHATVVSLNVNDKKELAEKVRFSIPAVICIYKNKTKKNDVRVLREILAFNENKTIGELFVEE